MEETTITQPVLRTGASTVILERVVGNGSESASVAVPCEPRIMSVRAPSHPGAGRGGSAVSTLRSRKEGLSPQTLGLLCMVLLRFVVPLQLTPHVVLAIANLSASSRSM